MRPSCVCVNVSQNVIVEFVAYAMNSLCCGRAMHEDSLLSETGHSETDDPVDASMCLILLSDTTKRCAFDQRRLVLYHGVTVNVAGMFTSRRPSLLS